MADVFLLLVMSLVVRHGAGGKFDINRVYLTRMVAELRTLCPYNDGCKAVPDWQSGVHYTRDTADLPGDELAINPFKSSCCSWCYCDDSCVEMGRCCPEYFLERFADGDAVDEIPFSCVMDHLKVPDESDQNIDLNGRFKIDKCSEIVAYYDAVRLKCEQRNISNIDEVIPVISMDTRKEYVNVFCARCNGDTNNVVPLSAYAGSNNREDDMGTIDTYIQQHLNWQEIYKLTYDPNSDLNLYFGPRPYSEERTFSCIAPVVYDCNVTGMWQTYEPYYEFACKLYRTNYYYTNDISIITYVFGNVFCMMCNGMKPITDICHLPRASNIYLNTYMALLNYREQETAIDVPIHAEGKSCPDTDFYDLLNDMCRPWLCPLGSTYNGQTCMSAVSGYVGSSLVFVLKVRPVARQALPSEEELISMAEFIISTVFLEQNSPVPAADIPWHILQIIQVNMLTDSTEGSDRYDLIFLFYATEVATAAESKVFIQRYLAAISGTQTNTFTNNGSLVPLTLTGAAENIMMQDLLDEPTLVNIDDGTTLPRIFTRYGPADTKRIIRVKKIDHCLLFTLRQDEYVAHVDHITLTNLDTTFYITQYSTYDVNQSVSVCVQDYLEAVKAFTNEAESQKFDALTMYLSIFTVVHAYAWSLYNIQ